MTRYKLLIVLLAIVLPATLTAERKITLRPPLRIDHDHAPIAQPKNRNVSETFAILYNSWTGTSTWNTTSLKLPISEP